VDLVCVCRGGGGQTCSVGGPKPAVAIVNEPVDRQGRRRTWAVAHQAGGRGRPRTTMLMTLVLGFMVLIVVILIT
jgi:hypothetical protein